VSAGEQREARHRSYDSEAYEYNYTHMSAFESTSCDLSLPDSGLVNVSLLHHGRSKLRESELWASRIRRSRSGERPKQRSTPKWGLRFRWPHPRPPRAFSAALSRPRGAAQTRLP